MSFLHWQAIAVAKTDGTRVWLRFFPTIRDGETAVTFLCRHHHCTCLVTLLLLAFAIATTGNGTWWWYRHSHYHAVRRRVCVAGSNTRRRWLVPVPCHSRQQRHRVRRRWCHTGWSTPPSCAGATGRAGPPSANLSRHRHEREAAHGVGYSGDVLARTGSVPAVVGACPGNPLQLP